MIEERTWDEFRKCGLLWFTNTILQIFGWSLVVELNDNNSVTKCYPARSHYRGFSDDAILENSKNLTQYMIDNAKNLIKDCEE